MPRAITVPEDLHRRLAELAAFAGCEPADVIRRLLDSLTADPGYLKSTTSLRLGALPNSRPPRARGAKVELDGEVIEVDSVRDLYEKVLRLIVKNGKKDEVRALLPYKTSPKRYLVADKAKHPNGNPFFVDVEQGGLHMEAHKSYHTAFRQVADFLSKLGITFRYVS